MLGTFTLVGALVVAGWIQGHELNDAAISFAAIAAHTKPWLLIATAAQAVLLAGNLLLLVHLVRVIVATNLAPAPATFRQPPTMEASAS